MGCVTKLLNMFFLKLLKLKDTEKTTW